MIRFPLLSQLLQEARYRANTLEELVERILFVGRVQVIVWQTEAHQDNWYAQDLAEEGRYGNRAAFTDKYWLTAIRFLKRGHRCCNRRAIRRDQNTLAAMDIAYRHFD